MENVNATSSPHPSPATARMENSPSWAEIKAKNAPFAATKRTENAPSDANMRTENDPSIMKKRKVDTPSNANIRTENNPCSIENRTEKTPPKVPDVNSYKFSRPRFYVQNQYPDSDLNVLERLKLIAQNVGPKQRSVAYNNMLTRLLEISKPKLSG
jgi:hypothetical protein